MDLAVFHSGKRDFNQGFDATMDCINTHNSADIEFILPGLISH